MKNPEKMRIYEKNRNKDIKKQGKKRWYENNRHKVYATSAIRRAIQLRSTPKWANEFFMQEIYDLSLLRTKHTGIQWSVDHIVPLRGKTVCGLHVDNNMRVIPAVENLRKSNRYWPDMPEATL